MKLLSSSFLLMALSNASQQVVGTSVIISEVADKGSSGVCNGEDWVELYNVGDEPINLMGYQLYDDNGPSDSDAFLFSENTTLNGESYLHLCCDSLNGPGFGIGGEDTITLMNPNRAVVSSVGPLTGGTQNGFDITYALTGDGRYAYTTTPTPGAPNAITAPLDLKEKLAQQNKLGERFFDMDDQGRAVAEGMAPVLELHIQMSQPNRDYLFQNRSFEEYVPFESVTVNDPNGQEIVALNSPGRIRPKGQWSLFWATCSDAPTMPLQLDMDHTNQSQTLFGVERFYLRDHSGDNSNLREWSAHRMLARFGLPHLRARHVNVFINNDRVGFYTLLEAPDQEYVFGRSFPSFDPESFALFKVKSLAIPALGCESYQESELEVMRAQEKQRSGSDSNRDDGPYTFERGDHRAPFPVMGDGDESAALCFGAFFNWIFKARSDAAMAYVREGEPDCGSFYVKEGFIDRDLGKKQLEPDMIDFINDFWDCGKDNACTDTAGLSSQVDVDNFLKSFAFYASTLFMDSPMGNLNNFYFASAGDGEGWKIVGYDHNSGGDNGVCTCPSANKPIYWSILRPTCQNIETNALVGPLLSDPALHEIYLGYIESFVETTIGNSSFIETLEAQLAAIKDDVKQDYWSSKVPGAFESYEMSKDPTAWEHEGLPWVPFLKARSEQIRLQLDALKVGEFPRGPHLEVSVEEYETCVDWRSTEPLVTGCFQNCEYEGCYQEGWVLPGWCDVTQDVCVHAEADPQCDGVADGGRYEGMENRPGDIETMCWLLASQPAKLSRCPAPPRMAGEEGNTTNASTTNATSPSTLSSTASSSAANAYPSWLALSQLAVGTLFSIFFYC